MLNRMPRLLALTAIMALSLRGAAAEPLRVSPGQTHFTRGVYEVTAPLTMDGPATFDEGAVLDIQKGATVTFKGPLAAGSGQVFAGQGRVAGLQRLTPEWFGAAGDGQTDDTAPFQRALDSFSDDGFWTSDYRGHSVLVLRNAYRLSSVSVNLSGLNIQSENARLIAMKEGSYPYLIRFTRQFCSISGYLTVEGSYNLGYGCLVNVNTRHFTAHNVHIWRANLAWRFGNVEWGVTNEAPGMSELGDSEIEIVGGATVHCLRGIEAIGSNTIVTFTDALVYSYPWTLPAGDPRKAAWESADATLIRSYGALVYYTGGELCNFSASTPAIEVQPLRNTRPEYFSHYGGVYISNTHIESGYLFRTANPRGIRQQDYQGKPVDPDPFVSLWMVGCGGYVRENRVPVETDPLFTGALVFANCNFYGPRSEMFAKLDNPRATIQVDDVTLRNKWRSGLGAIQGGAPLFGHRTVLEARMRENRTVGKDLTQLRFGESVAGGDSEHFRACYDPATGAFTVPPGGLQQVTVTVSLTFAEVPDGGPVQLAVLRNGQKVFATTSTGSSASLTHKFGKLTEGDRLAIAARSLAGTRVIAAGEGSGLCIEASHF